MPKVNTSIQEEAKNLLREVRSQWGKRTAPNRSAGIWSTCPRFYGDRQGVRDTKLVASTHLAPGDLEQALVGSHQLVEFRFKGTILFRTEWVQGRKVLVRHHFDRGLGLLGPSQDGSGHSYRPVSVAAQQQAIRWGWRHEGGGFWALDERMLPWVNRRAWGGTEHEVAAKLRGEWPEEDPNAYDTWVKQEAAEALAQLRHSLQRLEGLDPAVAALVAKEAEKMNRKLMRSFRASTALAA